jgi:hypothetical protein
MACSDDTKPANQDGSVPKKEGGTTADTGPVQPLTCKSDKSDCKDFVMSKLIMPVTDPQKYGLQFEGKTYNALGAILGALSSVMGDLQGSVDGAVNSGTTVVLMRMQAASFSDEPAAKGQAWIGAKTTCCAKPDDKTACATEAAATCFKGDFKFEVDPASPTDAILSGKIASSNATMSAPKLQLSLPITNAGVLKLNLKAVQLRGKLDATGMTDGVLAGALSKEEVDNSLIPTVTDMLNTTLKDPAFSQATKDQILNLFDANKDKTLTKDEVAGNALITTFLAGDVDVDKDGAMDLSLGIGFTAAGAAINK